MLWGLCGHGDGGREHHVGQQRTDQGHVGVVGEADDGGDDAIAFATTPDSIDASRAPRRLHRLVEAMVAALSAKLSAVHLHVGADDVLRASLQIDGPQGEIMLPAHFADGVALAEIQGLNKKLEAKDAELTAVKEENAKNAARIKALEDAIAKNPDLF